MDLFDTLTWAKILVKATFLGTPTLTVLMGVWNFLEKFGQGGHVLEPMRWS
jgi:hypothetical protein